MLIELITVRSSEARYAVDNVAVVRILFLKQSLAVQIDKASITHLRHTNTLRKCANRRYYKDYKYYDNLLHLDILDCPDREKMYI